MKNNFGRPEQYMAYEIAFHEEFGRATKNAAIEMMLRMMYEALAEGVVQRVVDRAHRQLRVVVLYGADAGQDRAGPCPPAGELLRITRPGSLCQTRSWPGRFPPAPSHPVDPFRKP